MTPIEFANYQRRLNAIRLNELAKAGKIEPKALLLDEDFDVSINNIPIEIKIPTLPQEMNKDDKQITNQTTSKPLF